MEDPTASPQPRVSARQIRFFVGVDGGGSNTRARLTDAEGRVLGRGEAGPSGLGQGVDQALANTSAAIAAAFQAADLAPALGACAVGVGLAGAGISARAADFVGRATGYGALRLETDAYAALVGAHLGRAGAIVIAGTGSVALARHADGRRVEVGGWGFPAGDEGAGGWLGLQALGAAQRAADGRAEVGQLARAVWQITGATRSEILAWQAGAAQYAYARLAPAVFDSAATDPAAAQLLQQAGAALQALVAGVDPSASLPICVFGSVGRRLQPLLPEATRRRCLDAAGDAIDGALLMVREALAMAPSPIEAARP